MLFGLRSKPVPQLRSLCLWMDRVTGLQGSQHQPVARPRASQPGIDQDREAGGHRKSKGLPQRSGQILVAVTGTERRQESVLDQLRKDPRSHREADILPGRRPSSGYLVRFEKRQRYRKEARRVRRTDGGAWLHRASGSAAGRMVYAGETSRLKRMQKWSCTSSIGA